MLRARQAAAEVVHAVCEKGESIDAALIERSHLIDSAEAGLFQELAYGGVRWYLAYFSVLSSKLKKPFKPKDRLLNAVLVVAMYQLDYTEQASHAVVNEAVAHVKTLKRVWAAGVVNAVLRAYMREQDKRPIHQEMAWVNASFPVWLVEQIDSAWPENVNDILRATQKKPPMTLRVNVLKTTREDYLTQLTSVGIEAEACADSAVGITLTKPMPVHKLPNFDEGRVSVQDESAQLAVSVLPLAAGQRVLDACAAPGGKSVHILEAMPKIKELVALDFEARLPRLHENLNRTGQQAAVVAGDLLEADQWWDGTLFDTILLDVPCTGTGVIRRHPDIKFRRQAENALQFSKNQLKLLKAAWQMLQPGGALLYTTCSVLPAENQDCIAEFLALTEDANTTALPEYLGIETTHGRQRLPGVQTGDGFFYALLNKTK
ncbi:MAG: 16S rRNA (cytosine(967)-C(5))-methyltransferase RsmB [Arenicellales bacterium]